LCKKQGKNFLLRFAWKYAGWIDQSIGPLFLSSDISENGRALVDCGGLLHLYSICEYCLHLWVDSTSCWEADVSACHVLSPYGVSKQNVKLLLNLSNCLICISHLAVWLKWQARHLRTDKFSLQNNSSEAKFTCLVNIVGSKQCTSWASDEHWLPSMEGEFITVPSYPTLEMPILDGTDIRCACKRTVF
jgi:hypothetical protein